MVRRIGRHRKPQEDVVRAYASVRHLGDLDASRTLGLSRNSVYTYRTSHPEARPDNWMTGTERRLLRCKKEDVKPKTASHRSPLQTILFNTPDGRVNRVSISQAPWAMA